MRLEAFIQARMGSTRLPGKVLKPVLGRPLLDFLIERLKQAKELDDIVVLTTAGREDDSLAAFCEERGLACFRGSSEDVLDRYCKAALQRQPEGIVRITADCPLIDPEIVDQVIKVFRTGGFEYVSNGLERTFPRGLDVEVFTLKALQKACKESLRADEREHVTVYFYRHPELFNLKNVVHVPNLGNHRWTVDTEEDLKLVTLLLEHLYPTQPRFRLSDILQLLAQHPDWSQINAHIPQKLLEF